MNKHIRLATGDRVEITDENSPHFKKTGILVDIQSKFVRIIGMNSKVLNSKEEYYFKVKLDNTNTIVDFIPTQLKKV